MDWTYQTYRHTSEIMMTKTCNRSLSTAAIFCFATMFPGCAAPGVITAPQPVVATVSDITLGPLLPITIIEIDNFEHGGATECREGWPDCIRNDRRNLPHYTIIFTDEARQALNAKKHTDGLNAVYSVEVMARRSHPEQPMADDWSSSGILVVEEIVSLEKVDPRE